jgi:hypothetical protein
MSAIASTNLQDIDVLLGKVSAATGLSVQAISKQLDSAEIQAFRFNDTILISPDDFDGIIDAWAENIKSQLSIKPSSKPTVPMVEALEDDEVIEEDEAIDADQTPAPSNELNWSKGFEDVVTHLYTHTFKRILPDDSAQKQLYLKAIANETTTGKRLTDELVNAIVTRSKRNLAPEKVKDGLIAKCAEMLKG